jgi:hypothetical protein
MCFQTQSFAGVVVNDRNISLCVFVTLVQIYFLNIFLFEMFDSLKFHLCSEDGCCMFNRVL